jgi:hypothetical protein
MKERKYFMMKRPPSGPEVISKAPINASLLFSAIAVVLVAAIGLVILKVLVPQADFAVPVMVVLVLLLIIIYAVYELFNVPLLVSAIAVALIASIVLLILNVVVPQVDVLIPVGVVLGMLLALAYASHELFIVVTAPEQDKDEVSRACISAFGGAFLLGSAAAVLAFFTHQRTLLVVAAVICLLSVVCLLVFIKSWKSRLLDRAQ